MINGKVPGSGMIRQVHSVNWPRLPGSKIFSLLLSDYKFVESDQAADRDSLYAFEDLDQLDQDRMRRFYKVGPELALNVIRGLCDRVTTMDGADVNLESPEGSEQGDVSVGQTVAVAVGGVSVAAAVAAIVWTRRNGD